MIPGPLDGVGPELAGADERRAHAVLARRAMSASTSSPTIHVSSGSASTASSAARKYVGLGLPSTVASTPAAYSSPATNAPESSSGPRRLPPRVLVQAVELRARVELGERSREVHVREDGVRLGRLVRAADQHDLGVLADELHALEVLDDRRASSARARAGERVRGGARRRLELVVVELDAHRAELRGERGARLRGVVRDEAEPVPASRSRLTALGRPGSARRRRGARRRRPAESRPWSEVSSSLVAERPSSVARVDATDCVTGGIILGPRRTQPTRGGGGCRFICRGSATRRRPGPG